MASHRATISTAPNRLRGGTFRTHPFIGLDAAFRQHFGRQQLDGQPDQHGQQNHIIHIAQHRDEIWNQVDGTQGIGHHKQPQRLGIPRRARILAGKPQRHAIALDALGPDFQGGADAHAFPRCTSTVICDSSWICASSAL